jgi:hypothetical protein
MEGYRRLVKKRFRATDLPLTVTDNTIIAESRWLAAHCSKGPEGPNLTGQFGLPMASEP